jgi:uncharacterized protein (TIGR03435 family)
MNLPNNAQGIGRPATAVRALLTLVAGSTAMLLSQAMAQPLSFEVASVKPSGVIGPLAGKVSFETGPATVRGINVTLLDCLHSAYEDQYVKIRAPEWVHTERFVIEAKAENAAPKSQLMAMLRTLLADRFRFAAHAETESLMVYALVAGKGPLLIQESAPDEAPSLSDSGGRLAFKHISMQGFVQYLNATGTVLFHLEPLPVIDLTEISGFHDLTLPYGRREFGAERDDGLFLSAMRKLGLELARRKAPVRILVVDHVERPSEN